MKYAFVAIGFLLATNLLFGQAPYAGGQGDGYAKVSLVISNEIHTEASAWIVQQEGVLHLQGVREIAHWQIFDAVGREVTSRNSSLSSGKTRIVLPKEKVATGTYLVKIDIDGKTFVRKWVRPQ